MSKLEKKGRGRGKTPTVNISTPELNDLQISPNVEHDLSSAEFGPPKTKEEKLPRVRRPQSKLPEDQRHIMSLGHRGLTMIIESLKSCDDDQSLKKYIPTAIKHLAEIAASLKQD